MKPEYIESMTKFTKEVIELIISKDDEYNVNKDVMDYFPKGWDSCFTYLNENLNRLDSMILAGKSFDEYSDKLRDLLAYTLLTKIKLEDMNNKKIIHSKAINVNIPLNSVETPSDPNLTRLDNLEKHFHSTFEKDNT